MPQSYICLVWSYFQSVFHMQYLIVLEWILENEMKWNEKPGYKLSTVDNTLTVPVIMLLPNPGKEKLKKKKKREREKPLCEVV